ncbi:MAG: hypothetical protein ABIE55_01100 [Candidatus Aenigmatarchaeota archaeon]
MDKKKVQKMTLIVSLEGKDFIAVGSDSEGSREDSHGTRVDNIEAEKLIQLTKFSCALIAGDAEIGTELIEEFKSTLKNTDKWNLTDVVKKFSKFCKKEISHISDVVSPSDIAFPYIIFILTGLDKKGKKFIPKINVLRSTRLFCPGREKDKSAKGKPMIAYYILDKYYDKNFCQEDMLFLIGKVISETMRIDGDVGGKIKMAIIDNKGFRNIKDSAVEIYTKDKEMYKLEKENKELENIIKE